MGEISSWSEGTVYKLIFIRLIEFKSPGIQEELSMLKLINFFLMLPSFASSVSGRNTKTLHTEIRQEGIVVFDRIPIEK